MPDYLITLSIYITNTFSPEVLVMFCVFMLAVSFLYLNIKGIRYREILSVNCPNNIKGVVIMSSAVILGGILSVILKSIFRIFRPESMLVWEKGYSFPSGHTAMIFAFCFSVIFILFKYFKDNNHWALNYLHSILFISIALLVSFTRLVLQVHRYEDILAGLFLGAISAFLSIKMYYTVTKHFTFYKNF